VSDNTWPGTKDEPETNQTPPDPAGHTL